MKIEVFGLNYKQNSTKTADKMTALNVSPGFISNLLILFIQIRLSLLCRFIFF